MPYDLQIADEADHARRADDPEYIVRLIGQVITVSLETVNVVGSLPSFE